MTILSSLMYIQATTPTPATTIDGAMVVVLLAVGTAIPVILDKILVPIGKAIVTRWNTGTDQKIEELSVFKMLKNEVERLQSESTKDKETITGMQKQILDLQQQVFTITQTSNNKDIEIAKLKLELQNCKDDKTLVVAKA